MQQKTALTAKCPAIVLLALATLAPVTAVNAQVSFRGVWSDAFHPGFKSVSEINSLVQRAVDGNYNAIIAEVLAFQDNVGGGHGAYWDSDIVPMASDIGFGLSDPLAYLCDLAHANGIEVHAWLVTYRVCTNWPPSGNPNIQPEWISVPRASAGTGPQKLGSYYFMDPGSPDVQEYLLSIVRELVTNYPIDGINWDYIRYTETDAGYPADLAYDNSGLQRYYRTTGYSSLPSTTFGPWDDFRRRGISELVRRCRAEIPVMPNPRQPVRLTADVFATGDAPGNLDFTATSAWARFQDWRLWMERGWLDAAIPMNYKREHLSDQASWYRDWVDAALDHWRYDRQVFNGQANYLNSMANSITQLQYCINASADGVVNYSYYATTDNNLDGTWENDWSWYNYVRTNLFTTQATIPTMPWRDPATATEGTVWGRVFDAETGLPVDDATVQINLRPAEKTDGNGYYAVTLVPASPGGTAYLMTVSKSGLPTATHPSATIMPGENVRYDFYLGETVPGDFDRDEDVDQSDFGRMQACLTGSGNRQDDPDCLKARMDDDADVDYNDVAIFTGCMTGEGIPGDLNCPN